LTTATQGRATSISLTVNGQARDLVVDPRRPLSDVLREDLDLTGAKLACDGGECGSCTVLLGGRGVMSCLLPVGRVGTKEIVTIEGLSACEAAGADPTAEMHPLQKSFVELGAAQCGFCIPGMIMEASALLKAKPNPTRDDVISRLSRNTCRCTGYSKIVDAVLDAARVMRHEAGTAPAAEDGLRVGARIGKPDGLLHVKGTSKYAADLKREGMLYAKILRSPHHHARIRSIDTSEAEAMEGVHAVITHRDIPGRKTMTNCRPQVYLLAKDKVHFIGSAVAAVAADSEELAIEATRRIKVDYEVLTPVFDPLEALSDESPQLHPPYPNWKLTGRLVTGDVDKGFAEADVVVEGTYTTHPREHAPMEPEAGLGYFDEDGRFTIHSPTHHFYPLKLWLAHVLALSPDRVRVIVPAMGGNFGHRGEFVCMGVIGVLSQKTGRPVKLVFTREESIMGSGKSHSYVLKLKTGARSDGTITALKAEVIANGGGWISNKDGFPIPGNQLTTVSALVPGPYRVSNADIELKEVCTNRPRSGPLRGTNMPDLAFAWESQMQQLAERLNMDPLEIRIINALQVGDTRIDGKVMDECVTAAATMEALRGPYEAARTRAKADPPPLPWRRGIGIGSVFKQFGGGRNSEADRGAGGEYHGYPLGVTRAGVELHEDGLIQVLTGAVEKGQGITIALAQIAAEAIDVPMSAMMPTLGGDTLMTPYPQATNGQRTTFMAGGAVLSAAKLLREALVAVASDMLGVHSESVTLSGGWASASTDSRRLSMADLAAGLKARGRRLRYESSYTFDKSEKGAGPVMSFASQLTELDVNAETGEIRVDRVTFVADPGRVLNPLVFEGQVDGGVMMGLGYALSEEYTPGESVNFKTYGLPTIKSAPAKVDLIVIENPVFGSPYGIKGAGETTSVAGMPSVANAIADAVGVRVYELPARPGRVLEAIESAAGSTRSRHSASAARTHSQG
jgi:CO/xanthine dehydrogenase Mo-binding subunit/aerobic-type carbon monoxide dehydrogenase small subunit (CoxS/CutS family)